jgi:hypothetical protein
LKVNDELDELEVADASEDPPEDEDGEKEVIEDAIKD